MYTYYTFINIIHRYTLYLFIFLYIIIHIYLLYIVNMEYLRFIVLSCVNEILDVFTNKAIVANITRWISRNLA